jgi:hypothetical protein
MLANGDKMFLIAEYCRGPFYMGWHLYLRDYRAFRRNKDSYWGWIRRPWQNKPLMSFLESLGITIHGDGTCDDDGIAEFAQRYPIKGRRCGGKLRGCVEVEIDYFGQITTANPALNTDLVNSAG